MRRVRIAPVALALSLAAVLAGGPAGAATRDISIVSPTDGFDPADVRAPAGTTFRWTNDDDILHTTTQDSPLGLWDSGNLSAGERFSFTIPSAGTFPYRCELHPGMRGTIRIPVVATPSSGTTATVFTITIASAAAPEGFEHDVQRKKGSGDWVSWKTGITRAKVAFDPRSPGTYRFRARLVDTSSDAAGGWSPSDSVTVT